MKDISPLEKNNPAVKQPIWVFVWISVFLTFLAYLPIFNNGFVNWDDPFYIQQNTHIHHLTFTELRWMWTTFYTGNWIPLSWISLAVDYHLGGQNPQFFHLDNLLLHCLNTVLVFFISFWILSFSGNGIGLYNKSTAQPRWISVSAFLVSLFFGIHPIHVESVVWASERKDLLCGFFFLSGIWVYIDFLSQSMQKKWQLYACFGLFLLALLSKSMAVSFPFVLLLLDYWPAKRLRSKPVEVFLEKVPFFIAAFLIGLITLLFQSKVGTLSNLSELSLSFRVMNAFHSSVFYLEKMLYPVDLATLYPISIKKTFSFEYVLSFLIVITISSAVFIFGRKRPFLYTAWLYYLVTLAPVIGIIQVGSQAAADRYTYLPCLGPLLLFTGAFVDGSSRWRFALLSITVCLTALFGYQTIKQTGFWKDSVSLWEHELRVYPKNAAYAYDNLAAAYEDVGRLDDALKVYDIAILRAPQLAAGPHVGKGKVLFDKGLVEDSIEEFNSSIALDPNYDLPHNYLGMAYEKKNMHSEALSEIQKAIQINPDYAEAYNSLGIIYRDTLKFNDSLAAFRKAISLDPINSKYSRNLIETCRLIKH